MICPRFGILAVCPFDNFVAPALTRDLRLGLELRYSQQKTIEHHGDVQSELAHVRLWAGASLCVWECGSEPTVFQV